MAVERTKEGVVVLDYAKVADPSADLSAAVAVRGCLEPSRVCCRAHLTVHAQEAFGSEPHCLGIVVVRGIPDYVSKRQRLLPLGSALGKLPADVKAKYEVPQVNYSIGWSHGKESFQGVLDTAKGSFYANPSYDTPAPPAEGAAVSAFTHPNVWPAEVPELEPAFKDLGQLIINVGRELAVHCDRFSACRLAIARTLTTSRLIPLPPGAQSRARFPNTRRITCPT